MANASRLCRNIFTGFVVAFCLLLIAYCLSPLSYCLSPLSAAEPESLSVYAPQARYSVPITELDNRAYVSILELLQPIAAPELTNEGTRWRLRVHDAKTPGRVAEAEFEPGSGVAEVRGKQVNLAAPARIENDRLMLPLHGIGPVLIPLLGTDIVFHENALRMFLGGTAMPLASELRKGQPSALELHFRAAVNPAISSEGNSLKFLFLHDPVVSFTETQSFNDQLFHSSNFVEKNGTASLVVNGSSPLQARFTNGGRTIVITPAPQPVAIAPAPAPAQSPTTPGAATAAAPPVSIETTPTASAAPSSSTPASQPAHPSIPPASFLVVIDPGHGGDDPGARIAPNLLEKDITLSLARKLRQELQARHVAVMLLRDADNNVSLDQRAVAANLARPAIFISLHSEPGSTMRIYTSKLPANPGAAVERNSFLPWDSAQGAFRADSAAVALLAAQSLEKRKIFAKVQPAFLQPLHSIAAPAIAVEAPANQRGLKIPEEEIVGSLADSVMARKAGVPK